MAIFVNMIASILLFTSIIYYVIIYTIILKKRTSQNIVIGGGAGAIPPVIGWASVTNDISLTPIILFFIIFLWTPPHFWALALTTKQDYKAANIPMLPNISGDESTKNQIIIYSILLWAFTILPYFLNIFGTFYFITANILSAIFLMLAIKLKFSKDINFNKKFFFFTIVYLFLLFTIMPFSS
jgi:protoheme IX farnesyltransferase